MSLTAMKEELHERLWGAQQRWFALRETGVTKHDLKMQGLREHGDIYWATRQLIFTGNTRVSYERVLKAFVDFAHGRGIERNADISKRDMRDYMEALISRGLSQSYLDKIRSAIVKFGALYGKYESFHAMSEKVGDKIRDLVEVGIIASPAHQRITPDVAQRAIERLHELDIHHEAEAHIHRAYGMAAELQRTCGLRAEEATERLTPGRLVDGHMVVCGKGGRERTLPVSADLYGRLKNFFGATSTSSLAPLRAYETAFRRAVQAVGGRSTGTHALRRLWAEGYKNECYREYVLRGLDAEEALHAAVGDTLEALGHSRERRELRCAYLRSA